MKSLLKNNGSDKQKSAGQAPAYARKKLETQPVAQCCAKTSRVISGCHD